MDKLSKHNLLTGLKLNIDLDKLRNENKLHKFTDVKSANYVV